MTKRKNNSINIKFMLDGFIFGLLFPLMAWIFEFVMQSRSFSMQGIIDIHKNSNILFIVDAAPIVLSITAYIIADRVKKRISVQEKKYDGISDKLNKYSEFAKEIGKDNFSVELDKNLQKDTLGNVLMLMRDNLKESKERESKQRWQIQRKHAISNILSSYIDIPTIANKLLIEIVNSLEVTQGAFYLYDNEEGKAINIATYAYNRVRYVNQEFKVGDGLIGQVIFEKDTVYRKEIPEDYASITSGILGDKKPSTILIVPLISDEVLQGIIEIASVKDELSELHIEFVEEIAVNIAQSIFNLQANAKTEKLLNEQKQLTGELKQNEEQLRQNAEEMQITQEELERANTDLENKIKEVKNAQNRIHALLEQASEVITIYDLDGIVKYESPSAEKILGYDSETLIGKNGLDNLSKDVKTKFEEAFEYLQNNPYDTKSIEFAYKKSENEEIYLNSKARNLLNNPAINGILVNTVDVTQRKIAEKEQRRRSQMQALSENSPDMIMRIGIDGIIYYANPMFIRYCGIPKTLAVNNKYDEVNLPRELELFFKEKIAILKERKEKISTEFTFNATIGRRVMYVNSIPEFNEKKELETILFVAHDITDSKKIELDIKDKNKKITESINYAERIQKSIIPTQKQIAEHIPESFVYYVPRDVVSGDFPWFFKKNGYLYIAAVDCTGHGVPGALLSFIGYFQLNNIVDRDKDLKTGEILDILHKRVQQTLKQDSADGISRDGMDIALCKINTDTNEVEYSGAHRPLYRLRNNELEEYKGNRLAIGGLLRKKKKKMSKKFTTHSFKYEKKDKVFFFSDGMPDQINENMKKYQTKKIKEGIIENKDYDMGQYKTYFAREFKKWKGNAKQIDDILVIGIEF